MRRVVGRRARGTAALAIAAGMAAALVVTSPSHASERIYYVATDGLDTNPGTLEAPWRTLTRSLTALEAGDTLYVRGGIYGERIQDPAIRPAGSSARILVAAFPGERPVVQGLMWLRKPSFWTFDGINATWDPATGAPDEPMVRVTGGTGWEFTNAELWNAHSYAALLVAGAAAEWSLSGLNVHDTQPSNGTNQDDLISITAHGGRGVVEHNTLAASPNGVGVLIAPTSRRALPPTGIIVRHNVMYDNTGPSNIQIIRTAHHNIVYGNTMIGSAPDRANVTKRKLSGARNVVRDNSGWGSRRVVAPKRLVDGGGNTHLGPPSVPSPEDPPPAPTPLDPAPAGAPTVTSEGLRTAARDSSSIELKWVPPVGSTRLEILRDGRLIDAFPAPVAMTYTDYMLWQSTSYRYEVRAYGADGALLATELAEASTTEQAGSWPRLYSDTSFWNVPIPSGAPTDSGSEGMVSKALVEHATRANLANTDAWGVALAYANPVSNLYPVQCTRYDCDTSVSGRIPRYAQPTTGSDHHLVVVDPAADQELDMWIASYDAATDAWSAGSRFLAPLDRGAVCTPPLRCNGAIAAGFSPMGGVVRPEEIAQGHIDHALALTTPYTRAGYIACPATHTDGKYADEAALPEGARVQLDPSFDVDATAWPRWKKVIARAFQEYGAYVVDTGGTLAIRGEADLNRGYDAWDKAGMGEGGSLADLPWNRFRVVQLESC